MEKFKFSPKPLEQTAKLMIAKFYMLALLTFVQRCAVHRAPSQKPETDVNLCKS